IALPLAAFSKGRLKDAALDFVFIFGLLGGLLGTYGMASNYNLYPTVSWPNFVSAVTHSISGFAALYIGVSKMASMKKKNIVVTLGILFFFVIVAYSANLILDYNYMFLMRPDGTPYEVFYQLVNGNPVLYPTCVVMLFVLCIVLFYLIMDKIKQRKK
ncbi:MAG: YwaF family protein, partial [Clostridia bacterium]|nr:YwaF family protein [Clostridia bacterium]